MLYPSNFWTSPMPLHDLDADSPPKLCQDPVDSREALLHNAAIMVISSLAWLCAFMPALVAPLPSRRSYSKCSEDVAGLTAWSDPNFSGIVHQYNVSWNTCSTVLPTIFRTLEKKWLLTTRKTVSMAEQFPYYLAGGVSSLAANTYNWCTVYPLVPCTLNPFATL